MPKTAPPPRKWYLDALAAFAFFVVAVMLGRVAMRALGPIAGIIVLTINGGLGWLYARAAWTGLMGNRVGPR
jgi:hypothetical protein